MIEDVGPSSDHDFSRARFAQKVRRQDFNRGIRAVRPNGANDRGKMRRSAIVKIVAIDRSDDNVRQPKLCGRSGDVLGLTGIERARQAGFDVAECASPRAGVAHDHESRVLGLPALADIWAAGLFAYGVQIVFANDPPGLEVASRDRRLDADPIRLRQDGLIRPMRLFRMTRAACFGNGIDQYGHRPDRFPANSPARTIGPQTILTAALWVPQAARRSDKEMNGS